MHKSLTVYFLLSIFSLAEFCKNISYDHFVQKEFIQSQASNIGQGDLNLHNAGALLFSTNFEGLLVHTYIKLGYYCIDYRVLLFACVLLFYNQGTVNHIALLYNFSAVCHLASFCCWVRSPIFVVSRL